MRRPNIIRPIKLTTTFPEDVRAKLDLHLYSEVEKRVPQGAIQRFMIDLINQYFAKAEEVDLQDDPSVPEGPKGIFPENGQVILRFDKLVRGLKLTPTQATTLASILIRVAKEASK